MQTSKPKVLLIHIALSTTLMLILLSVMLLWWYPKGLFGVAGGWEGLKILLPVDMVLGPVLTFLFYKQGKKSAVFDLTAIACVQLAAMSYGIFAVYSQHPTALVLAEGQLIALSASEHRDALETLKADKADIKYPHALDSKLPPVVVAEPIARDQYGEYLASILNGGLELPFRADRYQDRHTASETFAKAALSEQALQHKLAGEIDQSVSYYAMRSTYGSALALFSKESGELIEILPQKKPPQPAALQAED